MGVFNFMETFFFITLGISFVLIIMIVYHFKQRIIILEQKQDTMFEIINNIVKQIKNMQTNLTYLGESQNNNLQNEKINMVQFSNPINPMNMHDFNIMFNDGIEWNKPAERNIEYLEEKKEDSDEEESVEEDSDEEESNESSSKESSEDESSEDESDEDEPKENIKVINVENTDSSNLGILEFTEINSTLDNINELKEEDIVIHKMNTTVNETEQEMSKDNKDFYKKMSLSNLKAIVIEKGLSTDPSKLKKQELVKLLETSE
jgi:hypothetical protein